ncbi:GNAT family N-acetyltransferase [Agromyces marinus]|uniref:N-acetyltransferase domain-containing protein n=1 Tax=Agromyces marinus TaxID=1389020 RepID=A0ABM8H302_9MICO|nr:GNAT family N-acetyltransferase [Agromyces marinus]UIP59749.1 hypothetical protein DSM26151_26630 [Agromyces marinus]BDZ55172.1 hypothetical protein GCM10025870_22450 [Agromyces marinus]
MSPTTGAPPGSGRSTDVLRLLRDLVPQRPRFLRGPRIATGVRRPVIRTERLLLRTHRLSEADQWYAIQSDPTVVEHLAWPLRSRAESFVHLLNRTRHSRLEQNDDFLALAVLLGDRVIGDASLHLRAGDPARLRCEVGWVIAPQWQGHGYAREAGLAMVALAFDRVGAARVEAHVLPGNDGSIALAERLGFTEVDAAEGERVFAIDAARYRELHSEPGSGPG